MVYVLIVLGLAVVIAPLMSAMPSKSQRAKAALRDQARACNLRVSLRPLPPIPARFRFESDDEFACYERRLSPHLHSTGRDERFVSVMVSGPRRRAFPPSPNGCRLCPRVPPLPSCQNRL